MPYMASVTGFVSSASTSIALGAEILQQGVVVEVTASLLPILTYPELLNGQDGEVLRRVKLNVATAEGQRHGRRPGREYCKPLKGRLNLIQHRSLFPQTLRNGHAVVFEGRNSIAVQPNLEAAP